MESTQNRIAIVIYKHIVMYIIYINVNTSKVKQYGEYEWYDSVLCSLMWFNILKGNVLDHTIEEVG